MMRIEIKVIIVTIFAHLLVLNQVNGQIVNMPDNIKVAYSLNNRANSQIQEGNLDSALIFFDKQFKLLGQYYPAFEKSYLIAAELAAKTECYEFCFNLLDTLFSNGFQLDFESSYFHKPSFTKFRTSKYGYKLDSLKLYYKARRSIICDDETMRFMTELYYKDQVTRTSVLGLLKEFESSLTDTLRMNIRQFSLGKIDCENRKRFVQFLQRNKIEDFKYNSYFMPILYHTIFIHNLFPIIDSLYESSPTHFEDCELSKNEFYKIVQPFLFTLVCKGWLNNQTYAEIIDRTYSRHLGYQIYNSLEKKGNLNNPQIQSNKIVEINNMRNDIGLAPIY